MGVLGVMMRVVLVRVLGHGTRIVVQTMQLGIFPEGLPKGLADPGELSALTRRSGNPSCDSTIARLCDGPLTARSPFRAARRNPGRGGAARRAKKFLEAKVGFEPTWTALQTVASPHSATSPLLGMHCRGDVLSDMRAAILR